MFVTIKIECEDQQELLAHITCIRQQVKKLKPGDFDKKKIVFEDNNCYGVHEVIIKPDT